MASGEQIDDYHLYEGETTVLVSEQYVNPARFSVSYAVPSTSNMRRVCVVPRNDGLESRNDSVSCTEFNPIYPVVTGVNVTSSGSSALRTVVATWTTNASRTPSYKIRYTITSEAGAKRVVDLTSVNKYVAFAAAVNATVCVKVTPFTEWAGDGAPVEQCLKVQ